jgi:hypothetical protein
LNNIYAGFKGAGAATPLQTEARINAESRTARPASLSLPDFIREAVRHQ